MWFVAVVRVVIPKVYIRPFVKMEPEVLKIAQLHEQGVIIKTGPVAGGR